MDEEIVPRTFREKALFYTTAFFILLGTFSLFAFLFLVPFVIEPAFQTIFMQFDESPALCVTAYNEHLYGAKNCSWASCREGCTKDIYECQQIRVNYKTAAQLAAAAAREAAGGDTASSTPAPSTAAGTSASTNPTGDSSISREESSRDNSIASSSNSVAKPGGGGSSSQPISTSDGGGGASRALAGSNSRYGSALNRFERAIRADYDYGDALLEGGNGLGGGYGDSKHGFISSIIDDENAFIEYPEEMTGLMGNNSEWYFTGARLYPNVKGCGYPPILNCTIWTKKYWTIGTNFSCYYSRVDPELVISDLDMWQNTLNLVYAMAIPIPSFIISVIYLAFAYFVIFNEDEEAGLLDKNGEDEAGEDDLEQETDEGNDNKINNENEVEVTANHINEKQQQQSADEENGVHTTTTTTPIQPLPNGTANSINNTNTTATTNTNGSSKPITPNSTSDLNSFGHQLKVKMADEMSRESIDGGLLSNSASYQGNLSKTMTTSISTPPGPIAAV
ncbi:AGAP002820-PA [Anopheles gambiae str. PEST]|uniref:AGAP002820-PA n=1 Tax=Anopheles gambiae TaxID=7165 RepID=Q5TU11_ANOGA|nr:protein tipE isoform X1 [Anopheles gambiae]XP_061507856.1 protein tipE isoform X1 [Anopheles gambiae]XP_061507857.1 protein tipE isoform X1 [Anopheles gambiae]XP_061507858.1 protein tipE isoform X1 [Anopheles gambiae]XP_563317.4 protein tipE isoform X1 [Anopheles gambiae]EAL40834.4 AGAP002820-PA [Anopheles gambiae str. PEST]